MVQRRMPKKGVQKEKVETHYCSECDLGVPVTKHYMLDHEGKPICVRCEHSERARIRNEKACEFFRIKG